ACRQCHGIEHPVTALGSGRSASHSEELTHLRYTPQLVEPAILEVQTRPCGQVPHRARDEQTRPLGCGADPRRDVDGDPANGVAVDLHLASVDATAQLKAE